MLGEVNVTTTVTVDPWISVSGTNPYKSGTSEASSETQLTDGLTTIVIKSSESLRYSESAIENGCPAATGTVMVCSGAELVPAGLAELVLVAGIPDDWTLMLSDGERDGDSDRLRLLDLAKLVPSTDDS